MPHFQGLRAVQSQKTPRLIKSHLHYHVLPPALFKSKCKKIYVMRNPKDVFVSGLMLTKYLKLAAPDKSPEEFLETWLQDEEYATPWWRHVRDFWLHRDDPTILWLTYEHMVKDLPEAIRQIASHLDVKVTEKDVATLTEHCSFSNMKQNPSTNASWIGENSYVDKQFGGHIRKGRVGNWKEHLSEAAGNTIDAMVEDKLGDLDIQFDYGH
ncbi:sulfotransferase 1C4-like [Dreissena polymorpha]|uniref:sulfotransferase 1C4-like n=1 Tax=Dreissena polymorpha TaxID=45954 RepID=UPI002265294F|nr:sulfotransferase 1C4-like [Dreissena polymorpha]